MYTGNFKLVPYIVCPVGITEISSILCELSLHVLWMLDVNLQSGFAYSTLVEAQPLDSIGKT